MCYIIYRNLCAIRKKYLGIKKNGAHDLTQDYSFLGFTVKCEKQCFFP